MNWLKMSSIVQQWLMPSVCVEDSQESEMQTSDGESDQGSNDENKEIHEVSVTSDEDLPDLEEQCSQRDGDKH